LTYHFIKTKKFTKKKQRPAIVITEDELNFFLTTLKNVNGYPKVRDLRKLFSPRLNLVKIKTILRYLEKSKRLEIDLDGNIIWIREESLDHHLSVAESANISQEFLEYLSRKDMDTEDVS
jgi:quinolinate synthase